MGTPDGPNEPTPTDPPARTVDRTLWRCRLGVVAVLLAVGAVLVGLGAHRTVGGVLVLGGVGAFAVSTGLSAWTVRHGHDPLPSSRWWLCELPLVDHAYRSVGAGEQHARYWRCVRCGSRRWAAPTSVGESLSASRAETLWVRRDHD